MQQVNYGNNNSERNAFLEKLMQQAQSQGQATQQAGGQASPEDMIKQRIQQALLKQHTAAKPPTLETIGKGFEKNIGEGVAQTANYLLNSPRGQKITGALMASQNPEFGKAMYQSGTALESDYRQQAQQAQQRNQQQVGLAMQYLRDEQAKSKAEAKAKVDADKAAKAYTLAKGTRTTGLKKDFNNSDEVKSYKIISEKHNQIAKVWDDYIKAPKEKSKNALDQVLIMTFNKILDANSVVRESEFARTAQGQSLLGQIEGYLPKLEKGGSGLTDEERQDVVDKIELLQEGVKSGYERVVSDYTDIATEEGLNPKRITGTLIELSKMSRLGGEPNKKTPKAKGEVGGYIVEVVE